MENVKGARALVAGASGFLGRYAAAALSRAGAQVFSVSRGAGCDLRRVDEAMAAVLAARPDIVVHAAAPADPTGPAAALEDALQMGMGLVRAAALGRARFVMVARPGEPGSAVEAARSALLALCRAYAKQHRFAFVQLVPCALYGPLDRPAPGRTVASAVEALVSAKGRNEPSVVLRGHPDAPLPLLFAADAAEAVVAACAIPGCHDPVGLGPPSPETFGRVCETLGRLVGYGGKVSADGQAEWAPPADGLLAREVLGWQPRVPLDEGLKATVEWSLSKEGKR